MIINKSLKVLFVQDWLRHYRFALIEELASRYELTLLQPTSASAPNINGLKLVLLKYKYIKKFVWIKGLLKLFYKGSYDKYILPFDIHWINVIIISLFLPKNKVTWFGIGKGRSGLANRLKLFLAKRNSIILYSPIDIDFFLTNGVPECNISIANNTVDVPNPVKSENKVFETFLFIGSVDARKKIDVLLNIHLNLYKRLKGQTPLLIIIGDGEHKNELVRLSQELGLRDKVKFVNGITDPKRLREFYSHAICSLSYGQAGLSVLQSIANSTPFITCDNAISGGEINNIIDGVTGFRLKNDICTWVDKLEELSRIDDLVIRMSEQSFLHYQKNRTIEQMANGFKVIEK